MKTYGILYINNIKSDVIYCCILERKVSIMNCCTKKKLEELVSSNAKLAELLHLKKDEPEKKNTALYVFAIIGAIAAIAAIAYAVYRYLNPVYIEDGELEDEFEDFTEDDYVPEYESGEDASAEE